MKFDIAIIDVNTSLKSMQLRDTVKNVIGLVGNTALVSFSTYFLYRDNLFVCHADEDYRDTERQISAFEDVLLKERYDRSEKKRRDMAAAHEARKLKADKVAIDLIIRDTVAKYEMSGSFEFGFDSHGLFSSTVESSPNLDNKPFGTSVTKVFVVDNSETGYINTSFYDEGHKAYCIDYDAGLFYRMPDGAIELFDWTKYLFNCYAIRDLDDKLLNDYFMSSLIKYAIKYDLCVPIPNEKCLEFIKDVLSNLTSEQLEMVNKHSSFSIYKSLMHKKTEQA